MVPSIDKRVEVEEKKPEPAIVRAAGGNQIYPGLAGWCKFPIIHGATLPNDEIDDEWNRWNGYCG